jgi:hypothetical protein
MEGTLLRSCAHQPSIVGKPMTDNSGSAQSALSTS